MRSRPRPMCPMGSLKDTFCPFETWLFPPKQREENHLQCNVQVHNVRISVCLCPQAIRLCMPLKPKSLHVDLHEHHEAAYHSPIKAYRPDKTQALNSEGSMESSSEASESAA